MNWDRLNKWLNLLANLGVLVGLVVLIFEVRHAVSISERDALRSKGAEIQEAMQNLAMSADLAEIMAELEAGRTENLTPADRIRLSAWYRAMLRRMQNQFNDHQLGYLDEESNASMLRVARQTVPLFERLGNDIEEFQPSFVRAIRAAEAADPRR